jgi:GNAT superfamily N-acetyltransferase
MQDSTIGVSRFIPAENSDAQWQEWHSFRRARAAQVNPDDPVISDEEAQRDALEEKNPNWDDHWLVARAGALVVGSANFGFRRSGSAHAEDHAPYLSGGGTVLEDWRRRRIGTALLEHARQMMHDMGKTILSLSAHSGPGDAFLLRAAAVAKHSSVQNRARFDQLDWDILRTWEDGISTLGLTWESYAPRVPLDRLEALLPDFTRLIADMPLGGLDHPPIRFEMAGYRQWYEMMDRTGGAHHLLVLRDPTGRVVGLTETGWDSRRPDRVWQQLTATDPAWRGKGVARALKASMFRQIREYHPEVALMITGNAEANAPMLSINRRVGFVVHRRIVDYQVTRDALDAWAASLAG